MGAGASSKKSTDGENEVVIANVASSSSIKSAEAESSPKPEKPKVLQEVKRPRPAGKSRSSEKKSSASSQPLRGESEEQTPANKEEFHSEGSRPPVPQGAQPKTSSQSNQEFEEDSSEDSVEEAESKAVSTSVAAEVAKPVEPPEEPPIPRDLTPADLVTACRQGDQATVQAFLISKARTARGLCDNEEALFDAYGDSVLHHAVLSGSDTIVNSLLELGRVEVDIPNSRNETALQVACRKCDVKMANLLLQNGADPDHADASGLTPFLAAVFAGGNMGVLEALSKARTYIGAQDQRGVGALHFAALRGDVGLVEWMIDHKGDVDVATEHHTTPLMLASKRGHTDIISLLLGCHANTSLTDEAGCTALMHALSSGSSRAACKILDHDTSINVVDSPGRSALFHAVLGGEVDALTAVIKKNGRVNMIDEEGRSPLYQACLMGCMPLAQCLLDAHADPNLSGKGSTVRPLPPQHSSENGADDDRESDAARACLDEARTCLQVCATLAHNALLTCMMDFKADINAAPGPLIWTSLHLCAAVGNDEGCNLLLARGAFTYLQDAEGNLASSLAERAGHQPVLARLKEAEAAEQPPANPLSPKEKRKKMLGSLPPLHGSAQEEECPDDEIVPLADFEYEWDQRDPDGSLLDRVCGPMVHDALKSEQWRDRWEALVYFSKHLADAAGSPADIISAVSQILTNAAQDKVAKVFLAALTVLEELLSDARADVLNADEFTALLRGQPFPSDQGSAGPRPPASCDALLVLLDQTDAGGGSSAASSSQQLAADALCSCILHGRVPLDEAAFPLLGRIDKRLRDEAMHGKRKDAALGPKCLAANLKLLNRWLAAFGLQQSGLFRRSLVLPLLMRGVSSESSKVRSAAGDAIVQMMALSGGMEERLWTLLPSKVRKAVQRLASNHEGITLMSAVPCEEDAMPKSVIVSEDSRALKFVCVSQVSTTVWSDLLAGKEIDEKLDSRAAASSGATSDGFGIPDDKASEALQEAFANKNWKKRAESISALAGELASSGDGVRLVEEAMSGGSGGGGAGGGSNQSGGPLLSQYVLRGHRLSTLQAALSTLLADTVTSVFHAAADLLRLVCSHVPLYIAPLFLEPLLPALEGRLMDMPVKKHASETTIEIAMLHAGALSEMVAQCVSSGSAWNSAPLPASGSNQDRSQNHERSAGVRLQLLTRLVQKVSSQDTSGKWAEETWKALSDYAVRAAEHRQADVRKEAATLLNTMGSAGVTASAVADRAYLHLQALAQQRQARRPGTGSTRLGTSSTRLGTGASRAGTATSGRLSNTLTSTGRLNTSMRSKTGSSFRPRTGSLRDKEPDEESDNSVHSNPQQPDVPSIGDRSPGNTTMLTDGADGVQFFDVKTACPGGDEVPDIAEGEACLREALPLAEPLDEVALDFVAPLIALFGDGWTRCFYSHYWQCRVAALTHLAASMSHRLEEIAAPEVSANALGELLDGAMRAVHEGLGDQNVRVYAEACMAVTAVVPCFCGAVDGRLLVAHLAPLLRQLCARMGDSKEAVRTHTTQAVFRLLRPPTGNIIKPVAVAMLILRFLAPTRETREDGADGEPAPPPKATGSNGAAGRGNATGWLTRLAALRDLCKEHPKNMVQQPGAMHPGEWLRLRDGLTHGDVTVRHESARLYTLVCKMHLRSLGDEAAQREGREAWVAELPKDVPAKSLSDVRKLLKLPEKSAQQELEASQKAKKNRSTLITVSHWQVPESLVLWAGCKTEQLQALSSPSAEDGKKVVMALHCLGKAVCAHAQAARRGGASPEEAFGGICKAVQQALASDAGSDRNVFLCAVDLIQSAVIQLSPVLSGLDINMGLSKTFPTLLERTAVTGAVDVKIGVASDKLVQQLAKHPKVGCEAVTKMVISAVLRGDRPVRPLVLLRTLLSDFGLRLCAQRDVVILLLGALAAQFERLKKAGKNIGNPGEDDNDALHTQLIGVLSTCNQFSSETVQYCMAEVDQANRKLLIAALQEAPNPRLVALGATAAEQEAAEAGMHAAGSASRALSRGRGPSPKPDMRSPMSPRRRQQLQQQQQAANPHMSSSSSRRQLPRAESSPNVRDMNHSSSRRVEGSPNMHEASPARTRRQRSSGSPVPVGMDSAPSLPLSEASTAASTECPSHSPHTPSASPRPQPRLSNNSSGSGFGLNDTPSRGTRWCADSSSRPPAPMGLSTALNNSRDQWKFQEEAESSKRIRRVGSQDGRFQKSSKEGGKGDSLGALMDVLSQMDSVRNKTR